MVDSAGKAKTNGHAADDDSEEDADEEEEDEEEGHGSITWTSSIGKLNRHVQMYLGIRQLMSGISPDHPFLVAQQSRTMRLRNTISLDLGAALKQAASAGEPGKARVMNIVGFSALFDIEYSGDHEEIKVSRERAEATWKAAMTYEELLRLNRAFLRSEIDATPTMASFITNLVRLHEYGTYTES
ncbi:hypothetical protein LTS18_003967 [Coniosporium uncinatum]|uniref:Uncharacterized protein n=1 Tax=Coniosporium uncinatum TaxID=93489 RepID=A0ACC3DSZ0_9PEZI|nr:hypothetical protein LTS18_003967 [Coniosporium uncinatum]